MHARDQPVEPSFLPRDRCVHARDQPGEPGFLPRDRDMCVRALGAQCSRCQHATTSKTHVVTNLVPIVGVRCQFPCVQGFTSIAEATRTLPSPLAVHWGPPEPGLHTPSSTRHHSSGGCSCGSCATSQQITDLFPYALGTMTCSLNLLCTACYSTRLPQRSCVLSTVASSRAQPLTCCRHPL